MTFVSLWVDISFSGIASNYILRLISRAKLLQEPSEATKVGVPGFPAGSVLILLKAPLY